jgi:hypothetical protein
MKPTTLAILAVAAAGTIGLAFFLTRGNEKAVASRSYAPGSEPLIFSDLAGTLNDAAKLTIAKGDKQAVIERRGTANEWVVASKSGYPADFEKVRQAMRSLAEAKIVRETTNRPDRYELIGVNDHTGKADATNALITIADASGKSLASLIIGKAEEAPKQADSPFGMPTGKHFVRRAGEPASFLADIKPNTEADPINWVKRDFLALDRARTRGVTITHAAPAPAAPGEATPAAEVITIARGKPDDAEFALQNIPEGRELQWEGIASQTATALESVTLDDVNPAAEIDSTKDSIATAEFRTWDGLVLTIRGSRHDGKQWLKIEASTDATIVDRKEGDPEPVAAPSGVTFKSPDDVKKEAADLNARLSPWAFAIPEFKMNQIAATMKSLLKEATPPADPTQGPPTPGPGQDLPIPDQPTPFAEPK